MPANDHWIFQGRQSHGWFGTGTAPKDGDDAADTNGLFRPSNAGERVDAAAHVLIASVPRTDRSRWSYAASDAGRDRLKTAVAAWYGASALSREAFRAQFLDPHTSDETVDRLRAAARGLIEARDFDDLGKATSKLSTAVQQIGANRWPGFIGSAARKAEQAVSQRNVPEVVKADVGTDALLGLVIMGGIGFAIGSVVAGSQSSKQQISRSPGRPSVMQMAPPPPKKEAGPSENNSDKDPDTSIVTSEGKESEGKSLRLPNNPDELLKDGWIETTHAKAAVTGHRDFENPQTGEKISFDKGRPGETGYEGKDHYHRINPISKGDRDANLDANGTPVPRGAAREPTPYQGDNK